MTTLVPAGDNPGPRIGPKVFADVPTQIEVADAQASAAGARRARNWLAIICILLLGALVALSVLLLPLLGGEAAKQKQEELEKAQSEIGVLQGQLAESQAQTAAFRDYAPLQGLEQSFKDAKDRIAGLVADPAKEHALTERRLQRLWRVYNDPAPPVDFGTQQRDLQARIDLLEELEGEIRRMPPRVIVVTPGTPGSQPGRGEQPGAQPTQ